MQRFRVAEDSMRPTLAPGDEFVVTDSRQPEVGEIVVFPHPTRPDFWMVKRMVKPPEVLDKGLAWVLSDNPTASTADSRTLGPVESTRLKPLVDRIDEVVFAEGVDLLCDEESAFAGLVAEYGVPEFWRREPGFSTVVLFILEQQVSLESGAAVYRRVEKSAGRVEPGSVLTLGPEGLAATGVTRQKSGYILTLAEKVASGGLDLAALENAPAEEARSRLLELPGIGPWTADVYLLSVLRHIDIFPVGDRALQVGAGEALGMATPSPEQLAIAAEPWRPLRAVAARLIWHGYLRRRGRAEPPPPSPATPRRVEG